MASDWLIELNGLHLDPMDLIGRQEFLSCPKEVKAQFYFSILDESNRLLLGQHPPRQTEHQLEYRPRPKIMIGHPIRMKNLRRLNGISDK